MRFQRVYRLVWAVLTNLAFLNFPFLSAAAQGTTAGDSAQAQKLGSPTDPIEEHFRAAETSQLANDLNTAETEYRKVISLGLQKLAAAREPSPGQSRLPTVYVPALKEVLANSYHNLGVIYAQKDHYSEASQLFAKAAKWSTHIQDLDRNWGTASFRANDYKTAIALCSGTFALIPKILPRSRSWVSATS